MSATPDPASPRGHVSGAPAATTAMADAVVQADLVATAVLAVPGVAGMTGGMYGEAATYLPGRRVVGVQIHENATDIHVALFMGAPVPATADAIRAAVESLVQTPIHVTVQDLWLAEETGAS